MTTIETASINFMQGFPPSADQLIRFADGSYRQFPQLRWTHSNMQQLVPTKPVWRGPGAARELPSLDGGIGDLDVVIRTPSQ